MNPPSKVMPKRFQLIPVVFPAANFRVAISILAAEEARRRRLEQRQRATTIEKPALSCLQEGEGRGGMV